MECRLILCTVGLSLFKIIFYTSNPSRAILFLSLEFAYDYNIFFYNKIIDWTKKSTRIRDICITLCDAFTQKDLISHKT